MVLFIDKKLFRCDALSRQHLLDGEGCRRAHQVARQRRGHGQLLAPLTRGCKHGLNFENLNCKFKIVQTTGMRLGYDTGFIFGRNYWFSLDCVLLLFFKLTKFFKNFVNRYIKCPFLS